MAHIKDEDAVFLFNLLERLNEFFHQEGNFTESSMKSFATGNYKSIHKAYYTILWEILPDDAKEKRLE